MFWFRTLLLALALGLPGPAQTFPRHSLVQFWRSQDLLTLRDGSGSLRALPGGKELPWQAPRDFRELHATDEGFWANRLAGRGGAFEVEVHHSPDGLHWQLHTVWRARDQAPRARIFALGKGRFLAIAPMAPFQKDRDASNFAVLRTRREAHLEVDALLPMGLKQGGPGWIFVPKVAPLPDGWALLNPRTGHIWLVRSSDEGVVRIRTLKVFDAVPDAAVGNLGSLEPPLVAWQARPDGTLLLATRTEEATLKARAFARRMKELAQPPGGAKLSQGDQLAEALASAQPEALEAFKKKASELGNVGEAETLEAFPELLWWTLDGQTGTLKREPVPEGAPHRLRSLEDLRAFAFSFDPQGRFRMGN